MVWRRASSERQRSQPVQGTGYDFADFLLGLPANQARCAGARTIISGAGPTAWFRTGRLAGAAGADCQPWTEIRILCALYGVVWAFGEFGSEPESLTAPVGVVTPAANRWGHTPGTFPSSLVRSEKANFSPRVGIRVEAVGEEIADFPHWVQRLLQRFAVWVDCGSDGIAAAFRDYGEH